jgi:hypothetical protein
MPTASVITSAAVGVRLTVRTDLLTYASLGRLTVGVPAKDGSPGAHTRRGFFCVGPCPLLCVKPTQTRFTRAA